MLFSLWTPLRSCALLLSAYEAFSAHIPAGPGTSMSLKRRNPSARSERDWGVWASNHRDYIAAKYGGQHAKRSSGTNLLTNQNADSSYFGSLAIGTPAVSYYVILDTGSSDLWVAGSSCATGCDGVATFDAASSSTFKNSSSPFSITYGSGQAAGVLGQDVVQMAGFSVSDQTFALCDEVSSGMLNSPVSGLLGLAFQSIASSGATPLWQSLVENGAWDSPLMSFQLSRYTNDSRAKDSEPGGSFTMGFVNSSLYTGDIDYNDVPSGSESYWIQTISSLTSQANSISLPSGKESYAAIDTGTTLVGGPSEYIAEIYSSIEGSERGTGNYEGYYMYPCDTDVNITVAFGGRSWSISNDDFKLAQISPQSCLGSFFESSVGGSAPAWIFGDTFLKNVYSVFRYEPASVGFAELSDYALSLNGQDADSPTATIGSVAASVSATGASSRGGSGGSNGSDNLRLPAVIMLLPCLLTGLSMMIS